MAPWWGGCGRDAASAGLGVHPAVSLAWLQDCGVPRNPDYGPRLALSPIPESRPRVPSPLGQLVAPLDVCLRKMPSPRTPCSPEVRGLL